MVKLICTDVDGTLLNKQREIDDYTINVFKKLDKNIQVILISSRMPKALWHLQKTLNIEQMPIISYNGALVLSSGETFEPEKLIFSTTIAAKTTNSIAALARSYNVHISIYQNNFWLASELDFYAQREINNTRVHPDGLLSDFTDEELADFIAKGAHKIMLMGKPELIDLLENSLKPDSDISVWRSKDIYLEITPQTNKAEGLATLLRHFPKYNGITLADVMAFGDNYNDMEMLKEVKFGVAVGNSVPELKEIAYAVTKTNTEHGVAFYLDQFFNQEAKN